MRNKTENYQSEDMIYLACELERHWNLGNLAKIEAATGVTSQTLRNIVNKPKHKCHKATAKILLTYLRRVSK